jgi:serine/threonine protein kinase
VTEERTVSRATALAPARTALSGALDRVLNRGSRRNPDVLLVRHAGRLVVVKDFAPRGFLVRAFLAPWLAKRERRAWQALDGHPAVPRFLGVIDRLAFAVEYRPGRTLFGVWGQPLAEGFLGQLEAALGEMHRRGVAHLDLKNRTNVLCDEHGRPVLIDFGSAVVFRPGSAPARCLLPLFAWFDRRALHKWLAKQSKRKRRVREGW